MAKVSVPLLSFRLLLFLCFTLMIVVSFFSGLILLEGGKDGRQIYSAAVLEQKIKSAGLPQQLLKVSRGLSGTEILTPSVNILFKNGAIQSVFVIEKGTTNTKWETPFRKTAGKSRISSSLVEGIWTGSLSGRLFRDANGKRFLYPKVYEYGKKKGGGCS